MRPHGKLLQTLMPLQFSLIGVQIEFDKRHTVLRPRRWIPSRIRSSEPLPPEGGFLGIGGVPMSEAENATLTEISSALRLAA
jgi:hypothetical protein